MSGMVERVAKAIWEQRRKWHAEKGINLEEWGYGKTPSLNGVFEEARAAIEAMREPTEAMIGTRIPGLRAEIVATYHDMIDGALK